MKRSEQIKEFIDFVEECRELNEIARKGISEEEKRQQDLLHAIEFETSSRKRGPLDTKLHRCRKERRKYKDIFEETDEIVKFFGEKQNQKCLNDMRQLLGRLRKVENYHEKRTYIPRTKE